MNTLLAVMATIGILVTLFVLTAIIAGAIQDFKRYRQRQIRKRIYFGQKPVGRYLIGLSYYFKEPHAFNALYLIGKALEKGDKTHIDDIVKEVEELNNLKCKQ